MLDFSSALYLGMPHASRGLRPWQQLTVGAPASIATPAGAREVAQTLARFIGCERVTLAPSTLHLFWDLFGMLAREGIMIFLDAGTYPVARWGVERATGRGVAARNVSHHNVRVLRELLRREPQRKPVIVTDGFCPECGKVAPLAEYLKAAREHNGYLIIDDTQALGILGHSPSAEFPYGKAGGGALRFTNVQGSEVLMISSLAKGFGVPLALLAGGKAMIAHFEAQSETRVHCSPPSVAVLRAAESALAENEMNGEVLRLQLAQLVRRFRDRLHRTGVKTSGGLFPVQTITPRNDAEAINLHQRLLQNGVRTVLHRGRNGRQARLSFILTAAHSKDDIDRAIGCLSQAFSSSRVGL